MKITLIALFVLSVSMPAAAETVLHDPAIPDAEWTEFRVSFGDDVYSVTSRVELRTVAGEQVYQFTSVSPFQTVVVELSRPSMATRSVGTVGVRDGVGFQTVTRIDPRAGEQSDRVEAVNLDDLMLKLRGFAFSSCDGAPVLFTTGARGRSDAFTPQLSLLGTEQLRVETRTVEAHKLELTFSAPRAWRRLGLVPRTFLWYATEPPHALLRVETTEASGSPRWLLEAVRYSGW